MEITPHLSIGNLFIIKMKQISNNFNINNINICTDLIKTHRLNYNNYIDFLKKLIIFLFPQIQINYINNNYESIQFNDLLNYNINQTYIYDTLNIFNTKIEVNYNNYIVFHTKIRFDSYSIKFIDDLPIIKKFIMNFKTNKTIIILGERIVEKNIETISNNIISIYDLLLNLQKNNNVIDLSHKELYSGNPEFENFIYELEIINKAECNIIFGFGGALNICQSFSKNNMCYIGKLHNKILETYKNINNNLYNNINEFIDVLNNKYNNNNNNNILIKFIYFWPHFDINYNFITVLLDRNNIKYTICNNNNLENNIHNNKLNKKMYVFYGSFFNVIEYNDNYLKFNYNSFAYTHIHNKNIVRVLYLSEPVQYFYPDCYFLINEKYFDYIFGSIEDNTKKNYIKFPYYTLYYNYIGNRDYSKLIYNNNDNSFYDNINEYVKNTNIFGKYNFCLINSHDCSCTRKLIYDKINTKYKVVCPGMLFNNTSNTELNTIGKYEYLKVFLFNICPENYNHELELKGYITEKLLESCKSGCIPIFNGYFDDIDEKIFNKNRIIFLNDFSEKSLNEMFNLVDNLLTNPEKLELFYRQPVFNNNSHEIVTKMENNIIDFLKKI
jgi:hypothetical protein